jgi:hypothetical protein
LEDFCTEKGSSQDQNLALTGLFVPIDSAAVGFKVQGSGFRVQGSRFRVQGSGFKVQGSGFRV